MIVRSDFMVEKKNEISIRKASNIEIKFPENKELTEEEQRTTRDAIKTGGIVDDKGKAYINKTKLTSLFCTDKSAVNKFYSDLEEEDKFVNGSSKYASVPACVKETTKRLEQNRPQLERSRLKDSRDCMNAFIDSPELEKERTIASDRIKKELPNITKKKIKSENITCDQLTGEPFENDAEGHHKVRKADDPDKALDLDNIVVTKKKNHQTIHSEGANDPEKLKVLAEKKGWSTEYI